MNFPENLFSETTPTERLYRSGSPDTSREAAESLDVSRMESIVYNAINEFGRKGCISDEVRQRLQGMNYGTVTARYKALSEKGLISYTGKRRPGISGRNQNEMVASHWVTHAK